MKSIAIISRHAVANYGSILQAHALETACKGLGHDAHTINYVNRDEQGYRLAAAVLKTSKWKDSSKLKLMLYKAYQGVNFELSYRKFAKFRKQLLNETRLYSSSTELKNGLKKFDVYCTGSDQVWNTTIDDKLDSAYFLDFAPEGAKKIAYAASFGGKEILSKKDELKDRLKGYGSITVREKNGLEVLSELGLKGEAVLDPTFLLDKDYWRSMAVPYESKEKYILLYQLKQNPKFNEYADKLAKETGCKLVRVSAFMYQKFYNGEFEYMPTPQRLLGMIDGAECVLTDSFHATAFSINLNTPFIEILPGKYNSRNLNILELTGLEDRLLKDYEACSLFYSKPDYARVNEVIAKERERSLELLRRMIEEDAL